MQQDNPLSRYDFRQRHMGVDWNISVYAPQEAAANAAVTAAFRRIKQLNGLLSDYEPDSELMRLCRNSRPGKPVKVSRELLFVLSRSQGLSRQTGGAFDVTVGHLTRLWRNARRQRRFPKPDDLKKARERTGFDLMKIDEKAGTVELQKRGMRLDLGGIAKGFAGDEAMKVLRKHGITRCMIDGSGDIVVGDPPPGKHGWKIAVAPLRNAKRKNGNEKSPQILLLKNAAVATSGDAYQFVEFHGKRYSHIVDPKTGLGLTRSSSVTVIAPTGWQADSLASAVSVLGPHKGVTFLAGLCRTEASITVLRKGKPTTVRTCGFSQFLLE